jgi:hypothetical protein
LLKGYPEGHGMLYQNNAASPKVVFLLPMPHAEATWAGEVAAQTGLCRLLEEVAYFLQRKQGSPWPLQPVGSVSLSCYSNGAKMLAAAMGGGSAVPHFLTKTLKNVFVFDGIPEGGEDGKRAFSKSLARWFQNPEGRGDRNLRFYTRHATGFYELKKELKLAVSTEAPGGAREVETDTCTLVLMPLPFWNKVDAQRFSLDLDGYWRVHFSFPALLMEHAVTNSTF